MNSLTGGSRQRFYEGHRYFAIVMIILVFLLPIVGVFLRGLFGAVVGMVVSVIAYYLTPFLAIKFGE